MNPTLAVKSLVALGIVGATTGAVIVPSTSGASTSLAMAPTASTLVAEMIVAESVLSYLGVGVVPPAASWGSMLQESESLTRAVPRLTAAPGLAILLTIVGFNLLGEGLRDALDPKA